MHRIPSRYSGGNMNLSGFSPVRGWRRDYPCTCFFLTSSRHSSSAAHCSSIIVDSTIAFANSPHPPAVTAVTICGNWCSRHSALNHPRTSLFQENASSRATNDRFECLEFEWCSASRLSPPPQRSALAQLTSRASNHPLLFAKSIVPLPPPLPPALPHSASSAPTRVQFDNPAG